MARRWLLAHALLVAPAWCAVTLLVSGWLIAHLIIKIRNPNWVQDGEHAVLDLLGLVAKFALLLALISIPACS